MRGRLLAFGLAGLLSLSGCGGAGTQAADSSGASADILKGRYVETDITPGPGTPFLMMPHQDGFLDYVVEWPPNSGTLVWYRSRDGGGQWETRETPWLAKIRAVCGPEATPRWLDMVGEALYCVVMDEADRLHLFRITDGRAEERPISDWREAEPGALFTPRILRVTPGGHIGVSYLPRAAGAALYDVHSGDVRLESYDAEDAQGFAFTDNSIIVASSAGELRIIDKDGQTTIRTLPNADKYIALTVDLTGAVYTATHAGVDCLGEGMSVFENILDGSRYEFGDPGCRINELRYQPETDCFYISLTAPEGEGKLYRYAYDAEMPMLPAEQLAVYSLEESGTVKRAVLEFQRKHPEVSVDYRTARDSPLTKEEAAAALEFALAQGTGPDVLLLDGLDVEKLARQGFLLQLAPPEGCFPNVMEAFRYGDSIYALPARFDASVPFRATLNGKTWEGTLDGRNRLINVLIPAGTGDAGFLAQVTPPDGTFRPMVVAAVSAAGKKRELSKAFLDTLFSEEAQTGNDNDNEGFPVLKSAFERQVAYFVDPVAGPNGDVKLASALMRECEALKPE